ncbi:copper homeostasis protein CutC [Spiroplasma clarkii]|uniref:Copper homeostasis protein cutC homolog n=1 Tax=Spiroplasma clarkii TaxID=2139 RepID=A0A2K8KG80_9MOLU|nr:copper homeostasis protein CutC [Spiroplasma clarkii]ATX70697.1 copper homeostasis protein [Spiroplasma clarkii]
MYLEVIGLNVQDVIDINASSASRIELCSHLEFGGYTPDKEIIKEACAVSDLPVNVMVRRKHSDYFINPTEAAELFADIEFIASTKANAIVIGAITAAKKVDVDFMHEVFKRAKGKKVVFHRAFDEIEDKVEALKVLDELGVDTVLTSGKANIEEGFSVLQELADLNLTINILIGGGVNSSNINKARAISPFIHVGTAARVDGTFASPIDIKKIEALVATDQQS